jgi:hypothetical protein
MSHESRAAAAFGAVETVRATVDFSETTFSVEGENEQVAPAGKFEHANVTVPLNPLMALTSRENFASAPLATICSDGVLVMLKSVAPWTTTPVPVSETACVAAPPFVSTTCKLPFAVPFCVGAKVIW